MNCYCCFYYFIAWQVKSIEKNSYIIYTRFKRQVILHEFKTYIRPDRRFPYLTALRSLPGVGDHRKSESLGSSAGRSVLYHGHSSYDLRLQHSSEKLQTLWKWQRLKIIGSYIKKLPGRLTFPSGQLFYILALNVKLKSLLSHDNFVSSRSVGYHSNRYLDFFLNCLDISAAVLRKILVFLNSTDITFPSRKFFEYRFCFL